MRATQDYERFKAILPYASEIFGVYQPMIGWKSKRQLDRVHKGQKSDRDRLVAAIAGKYMGLVDLSFNADNYPQLARLQPGVIATRRLIPTHGSELLTHIATTMRESLDPQHIPQDAGEWTQFLDYSELERILNERVYPAWVEEAFADIQASYNLERRPNETESDWNARMEQALASSMAVARQQLEGESAIAGLLHDLLQKNAIATIENIFYGPANVLTGNNIDAVVTSLQPDYEDPFATFDPKTDIKDVSLSPIGIVHLFRQFFFEFDTFLGSPASHVWLSPGSSVELIETSNRKTTTERTVETVYESIVKSERALTEQEDVSEAVKQENRDDTKIGFSATVNQSWGTGSATATGSLNLDRTQQTAREESHRRMRQQSDKLSTEIRQNFKSTFKTVTEVSDVSSKRYLLANTTDKLINYELRRKMRQVGVQVQDIGTYLCWQTFVDEPGKSLGLANLVHIAKPADLVTPPDQNLIPPPPRVEKPFQASASWNFGDNRKYNSGLGYVALTRVPLPVGPDPGYQLEHPDGWVNLGIMSLAGEDSENQRYAFAGKLIGSTQLEIGVITGPGGIEWNERVDYVVAGAVSFVPTATKLAEIEAANKKITDAGAAAKRAEQRASEEAFHKAAKERIEQAAKITSRKFEELREEERTIVYRALIGDLMTEQLYNLPDAEEHNETRHVLSELLNAIFDIDKMLYFVAPEWWKPRRHYSQAIGKSPKKGLGFGKVKPSHGELGNELIVNWSDNEVRPDNYYITSESEPARLGSSLGWLLQLDGDNHRNAFLNAPWVKAVIPVRPGREAAAINWLQNVNVEGASGLDKPYAAPGDELANIRADLLAHDPADPVQDPPTISDAIRYLCLQVSRKHAESLTVKKFPNKVEIHDDDKVSATPIEKVYEHGFYPLEGGFRVNPMEPDPHNPDRNFQLFDQWVEVLPTDQIVPVEVRYDPLTGRQIPLDAEPHP